ncbi:MAG: RsmB/NOP family class I SAM-dependent RNA methyltransferase, partial [Bacteroidota bacterium]
GVEYSFPDWMVMRFVGEVGEAATPQLLAALNEQAPLTLRVNSLKISAEECRGVLKSQGVETTPATLAPSGLIVGKRINIFQLPAFRDGYFEVQDEGSQMIPLLLDPKPTAKVLDACAGAGGKSLGLSALMKNRGEIMATDIHSFRLDELRKRARRAGAFNIRVVDKDRFDEQADSYERFFDHVLVDAPCSGLGTIRRNPGMKWSVTEETVRELSEKQVSIVSSYLRFLKPGGTLLYATCTFFRQENEEVVERVLALHPEVRRADLGPSADRVGLGSAAAGGVLQLWPHLHGTDGFFCALLSRTE